MPLVLCAAQTGSAIRPTPKPLSGASGWPSPAPLAPAAGSGPAGGAADGSVVVGVSISALGLEAFRWSEQGGMIGLGDIPGGDFESIALEVSEDGSVVVGEGTSAESSPNGEPFRWTAEEGMVGLGYLPGGNASGAWAISIDGLVIVGAGNLPKGGEAFRWTAS